jgi:tRNA(Glu) U13 pseudouridine synthase TruD
MFRLIKHTTCLNLLKPTGKTNWIASEYGYTAEEHKEFSDEVDLVDYSEEDWEEAVEAYKGYLVEQRQQSAADSYEDEAQLKWYIHTAPQKSRFDSQMNSILELLTLQASIDAKSSLLVMLHGHTVSALESYLASTFIHKVTNSESLIRRLVETDPEFSTRKFTLKEIYEKHENLKFTVAKHLKDLIFHKINKVKPMYKKVLGCDFGDVQWLYQAVATRHHCVHRAGLDKDGNKIEISIDSVRNLVHRSQNLVDAISLRIE